MRLHNLHDEKLHKNRVKLSRGIMWAVTHEKLSSIANFNSSLFLSICRQALRGLRSSQPIEQQQ